MQAAILLILLTVTAVLHSEHVTGCLLSATALFVVFNFRSLSDRQGALCLFFQLLFSAMFVWCGGHFLSGLIFFEICIEKRNRIRIVFPGIGFAALSLAKFLGDLYVPQLLWQVLLLTACAAGLFVLEQMAAHYFSIQREVAATVRTTAVNELYEKKLNKELVLKNYLADRNARLEERENISRNIHNSVGHSITAAIMTLDAAELLLDADREKAKERVVTAKERMRVGLNSIRCAVRVLDKENRSVTMEDFISELTAVADGFVMDTAREVVTDFSIPKSAPVIPHMHTEFLTGAVQELLTNGVKHGGANRFLLSVAADSAHLQVSVKDNGSSDFSEENSMERLRDGFGLKKIVSYVKRCGGSVKLTNENGFCAVIVLPLLQEGTDESLQNSFSG